MCHQAQGVFRLAGFVAGEQSQDYQACPIIAVILQQSVRSLAARLNHRPGGMLEAPSLPRAWKNAFIAGGVVVALACGTWWGLKFKRVYLDYWPSDARRNSVFMRMTASDAKPFDACRFIRDNDLSGDMFNYWTEGGFIAWGQKPDPNTGRTPLRLFMDGRAQAAYDRAVFDRWTQIMNGGPTFRRATLAGRELTAEEYSRVSQWVTDGLRKHDVWVVLMPGTEFDTPLAHALEESPDWRIAFLDSRQKMFVDIKSERGKRFYENMFSGKVTYPDEYRADLAMGYNLLQFRSRTRRRAGLDLIIRGFRRDPSPVLMQTLLLAARYYPELRPRIDDVCIEYAAEFEEKKAQYACQDGYARRLEAARLAVRRLKEIAESQGDSDHAEDYSDRESQYLGQRHSITRKKRW